MRVAVRNASSQNLRGIEALSKSASPTSQLCAYVFFRLLHFVYEHEDKRHGEQCQFVERKNLISHIRLPNRFAWIKFSYQTSFPLELENHEKQQRHLISYEASISMYT
jgi:hypothetical protein